MECEVEEIEAEVCLDCPGHMKKTSEELRQLGVFLEDYRIKVSRQKNEVLEL